MNEYSSLKYCWDTIDRSLQDSSRTEVLSEKWSAAIKRMINLNVGNPLRRFEMMLDVAKRFSTWDNFSSGVNDLTKATTDSIANDEDRIPPIIEGVASSTMPTYLKEDAYDAFADLALRSVIARGVKMSLGLTEEIADALALHGALPPTDLVHAALKAHASEIDEALSGYNSKYEVQDLRNELERLVAKFSFEEDLPIAQIEDFAWRLEQARLSREGDYLQGGSINRSRADPVPISVEHNLDPISNSGVEALFAQLKRDLSGKS